jgi:Uma2 family endonuclease
MATDLKSDSTDQHLVGAMRANSVEVNRSEQLDSDDDRFRLFRDWIHSRWYPKRGRFSFLNGVLEAEMSPESLFDHNFVKRAFTSALCWICEQEEIGEVYLDGALLINEALEMATEPDLMFCLYSTLRDKRVEYRPYRKSKKGLVEVHGCPDVVVEIVSNSSVKKDKVLLKKLYFAAGIAEYWLIDARGGRLEFTIFQRGVTEFSPSAIDSEGFRASGVFNRVFLLERYANPIGEDVFRLRSKMNGQ